ncbi:hypothetical protein AAFF_G00269100 [Aldrovandia affinis]|uniref:Uncharacterized protein n=1 Tax=Aldrovandia affinis TaxID=143900 RepID=A0AAD7SSI1_9TELE|nr:hypothetical protein AAFF_G00269100 [Aldrovandia affinis]
MAPPVCPPAEAGAPLGLSVTLPPRAHHAGAARRGAAALPLDMRYCLTSGVLKQAGHAHLSSRGDPRRCDRSPVGGDEWAGESLIVSKQRHAEEAHVRCDLTDVSVCAPSLMINPGPRLRASSKALLPHPPIYLPPQTHPAVPLGFHTGRNRRSRHTLTSQASAGDATHAAVIFKWVTKPRSPAQMKAGGAAADPLLIMTRADQRHCCSKSCYCQQQ